VCSLREQRYTLYVNRSVPRTTQHRPAPQAGWSAAQSASGASTFLRRHKDPPGFPSRFRPKTRPASPLSMARLCAFAEQTIPATHHPTSPGATGRVVCGAKRIRSIYIPSPTQRSPGLSTTIPPKDPASLSTINGATYAPLQSRPSLPAASPGPFSLFPHTPSRATSCAQFPVLSVACLL